ncbi:MAG: TadE/TadG family type IV pilus assembly protein [Kiloniellaceae bacterium]
MFGLTALRRFLSCRKGASLMEFALLTPAVIMGLAGVIDFMMVGFVTSLMEGGLQDASRLGRTGFVPVAISRDQAILDRIAANTIGLVDISQVTVTYTIYPGFDSIGKPEPFNDASPFNGVYDLGETYTDVNGNGMWDNDMGVAGLGGPGDVVLYRVNYQWKLLTPIVGSFFGADGKVPIDISVAVRNEPFGAPPPPIEGG